MNTATGRARRAAPKAGSAGAEVTRVLWAFRRDHGWRPGLVWNPMLPRNYNCSCPAARGKQHGGRYVTPAEQTYWPSP